MIGKTLTHYQILEKLGGGCLEKDLRHRVQTVRDVGLGDVPAIRRTLSAALAESTPPLSLLATGSRMEEFRSDPEIHRLILELYRE